MKKYLLMFSFIVLLVLSVRVVFAQEFYTTNQATVAWDQDFGGVATSEVLWNIYLANAITDPEKANPVKVATALNQQYVITLNTEGKYFVGVSAIRKIGSEVVGESAITWSDIQGDSPKFGLQYFTIPAAPTKIVKQ
jgi:hypothetical protein